MTRVESIFFHSSVKIANLQNFFIVLEKNTFDWKKYISDIQWSSRMEAVEAIVKPYEVLVVYFDDLSLDDAVTSSLIRQLKHIVM